MRLGRKGKGRALAVLLFSVMVIGFQNCGSGGILGDGGFKTSALEGSLIAPSPKADALAIVVDRLGDTAFVPPIYAGEIQRSLQDMPADLREDGLTPSQKARRLQWAFKAANESTAPAVEIIVPGGDYDFSALRDAHASVASTDIAAPFLPKLYVRRGFFTVRARDEADRPRFFYRGAGRDGAGHGRVLLMVKSGLSDVELSGLRFSGDHSAERWRDVDFYAHENSAALRASGSPYAYGLLMIGLSGGANGVRVRNCAFEKINFHGATLVGNASFEDSVFEGVIPEAAGAGFLDDVLSVAESLQPRIGSATVTFNSGVYQNHAYGPLRVVNSTFRHLVEGFVGAGVGADSLFHGNRFQIIADHGIYLLSSVMPGSIIRDNVFEKVHEPALKFAAHVTSESSPQGATFFSHVLIQGNVFRNTRGAMNLTGAQNVIRDNVVEAHDAASDPGGFYALDPTNQRPEIWLSSRAGQAVFWNHFSFNVVRDNRMSGTDRPLNIYLQHDPSSNSEDRSLAFNSFSGPGQRVYFRARSNSRYAPLIFTGGGTRLFLTAPPNCSDCSPDFPGYRADLNVEWVRELKYGSATAYLLKYVAGPDIFLVTPGGMNERLNPPGRSFEVLATGDLNGDGRDEIYSREIGRTEIYGSNGYDPDINEARTLAQWYFIQTPSTLLEWSIVQIPGQAPQLLTRYSSPEGRIYRSALREDGTGVPVVGGVYSDGGAMPPSVPPPLIAPEEFQGRLQSVWMKGL